jgi:hypothetical protein
MRTDPRAGGREQKPETGGDREIKYEERVEAQAVGSGQALVVASEPIIIPAARSGGQLAPRADRRRRFPVDLRRLPGPDVGGELILSRSAILGVEELGRPFPLRDLVEPAGDEAPQESESAASAATNWPKIGLKPRGLR